MTAREKEYTEYKKLTYVRSRPARSPRMSRTLHSSFCNAIHRAASSRMFVGTWNVNGRMAAESLAPWLSFDAADADIYVMGYVTAMSAGQHVRAGARRTGPEHRALLSARQIPRAGPERQRVPARQQRPRGGLDAAHRSGHPQPQKLSQGGVRPRPSTGTLCKR